jgi:hypothetical protein
MPRTKLQEIRLPALKGVVRFARLLSQRTSNTTYHEVSITRSVISGSSWEDEHATRKIANCRLTSKSFRFLFFFISNVQYVQDVKNANGKKVNLWLRKMKERHSRILTIVFPHAQRL